MLIQVLLELASEVLYVLIIIHAAALLLELVAKCPHVLSLLFELFELVVVIGRWWLSEPEIDQHLTARLESLLDFLLGPRLVENLSRITRIPHGRAHPRPKDRND